MASATISCSPRKNPNSCVRRYNTWLHGTLTGCSIIRLSCSQRGESVCAVSQNLSQHLRPMFLSAQYAAYTRNHPASGVVRILPKSLYGKNAPEEDVPHAFFSHYYGSSWHDDDAGFIDLLAHWGSTCLVLAAGIAVAIAARLILSRWQDRTVDGYETLPLVMGESDRTIRAGSRMTPAATSSPRGSLAKWLVSLLPPGNVSTKRPARGRKLSTLAGVSPITTAARQTEKQPLSNL